MKTKLSLILGGLFLVGPGSAGLGGDQRHSRCQPLSRQQQVSVSLLTVSMPTTNAFTTAAAGTTALSFDPLTFNTTNHIYLA